MTNALRDDAYILPEHNVIGLDGQPVNIEPVSSAILASALADLDEPVKRPGRPKGSKSKNKPKKARAKKSKPAVVPSAAATPGALTHPAVGSHAPGTSTRIAPSGEGIWDRVRRIKGDTWLVIAAIVAALALGTSLAILIVR